MNAQHQLFGLFVPVDSPLHRLGVGWKFAATFLVTLVPLVMRRVEVSVPCLIVVVAVLLLTRVPWRMCFGLPRAFVILIAVIAAYHLIFGDWHDAVVISVNLVVCLYASRILTVTTPAPVLLDAVVAAARPLRVVGADPERIGLAVALMLRSIPYLFGSFAEVRDAARARGLERNIVAQISPVVVNAVAYAQATGEALAARGLGEGGAEPDEDELGE